MRKIQKVLLNFLVVIVAYVIPLLLFSKNQSGYGRIGANQGIVLTIILAGGALLTYFNLRQHDEWQWIWILFGLLGILGMAFSGFILFLIFSVHPEIG